MSQDLNSFKGNESEEDVNRNKISSIKEFKEESKQKETRAKLLPNRTLSEQQFHRNSFLFTHPSSVIIPYGDIRHGEKETTNADDNEEKALSIFSGTDSSETPKSRSQVELSGVGSICRTYSCSSLLLAYDEVKARKELSCWSRMQYLFCGGSEAHNSTHFNSIAGLCMSNVSDIKLRIKMREVGFKRFDNFINNITKKEALMLDIRLLIWCSLSLLTCYHEKQRGYGVCECIRRQKFNNAKDVYHNTLYLVVPEKQYDVVKYTVSFFNHSMQWNMDEFVALVFVEMLQLGTKEEIVLSKLIKQIELSKRNRLDERAQDITSALATILENVYWDRYLLNDKLHNCFHSLLKLHLMYHSSKVVNTFSEKFRRAIMNCLKLFVANLRDNTGLISVMDSIAKSLDDKEMPIEDQIQMLDLISFCAQQHKTKFYRESVTPDLFRLLTECLKSPDKNLVLCGHRILHHLLDRHRNMKYFIEPVYYFVGRFDFVVHIKYDFEDAYFFKQHSRRLFRALYLCSLKLDNCSRVYLTSFYMTICLILVEVPAPFITMHIIGLVLEAQNAFLKKRDLSFLTQSHIHATFASVMTLICLIHKEEVEPLNSYVQKVMEARAENAPHLLPPLRMKYCVAGHHTLEYHDELYFTERELTFATRESWLGRRDTLRSN